MQQRHDHDVGREFADALHHLGHCPRIERQPHSLRLDALAHADGEFARHEWQRVMSREVVERRTILSREMEQVGEPIRRDQRDACAGALEQHVGGDGGAVHESRDGQSTK